MKRNWEEKRMDIDQLKIELEEYGFVIIHNLIPILYMSHVV